jgi:hypothetical protein
MDEQGETKNQGTFEYKSECHELVDVEYVIIGWILIMVIGLVFSGIGTYVTSDSYFSFVKSFLLNSGSFILIYPGPVIFPIIAGAIIGREIGKVSTSTSKALKSGFINGFYGAVIYLLAVIIVYIVMNYFDLISMDNILPTIAENVVAPIIILILTTIGFALISHIRKTNI